MQSQAFSDHSQSVAMQCEITFLLKILFLFRKNLYLCTVRMSTMFFKWQIVKLFFTAAMWLLRDRKSLCQGIIKTLASGFIAQI